MTSDRAEATADNEQPTLEEVILEEVIAHLERIDAKLDLTNHLLTQSSEGARWRKAIYDAIDELDPFLDARPEGQKRAEALRILKDAIRPVPRSVPIDADSRNR